MPEKGRKMSTDDVTNLAEIVDEFALLREQIKELEHKQEDLRYRLILSGLRLLVGNKFVATLSESPRRNTDWKKVRETVGIPQAIIDQFTKTSQVISINCTVKE
jgi:hypothetical protein